MLALLPILAAGCEPPLAAGSVAARLRALERPNLVLCVVDTLRADWTTPYGGARTTSPELARWASRGLLFERVLSQSSWTKTSMASLLTSLWPRSHGVRAPDDALGESARTLAELLQQAGYATYAVQSNGWLEQTFGFHQGFDRYSFARGGAQSWMSSSVWPHADNVYLEAVRLLDAHDPSRPFFLYLHFMDVHEYSAPPDIERSDEGSRGAYLAAIRWVDEVLARLRAELEARGLLERSVMVLASDHAEAFGENGVHGHARNALSAALRVPLVWRLPFAVAPVRVKTQVRNLDIAPTLLEIAGLAVPADFEGSSLLPLLADPEAADRISFAALTTRLYPDAVLQESVTDGGWLFARDTDGKAQLFDRTLDPGEDVDLAEIEAAEGERLRALLDGHEGREPLPGAAQRGVRIDPELARRLRALGYVVPEPDPPRGRLP